MNIKKISIIGLGLIGGSLARAFKERLDIPEIIAVNRSADSLRQALEDGVITQGFEELDDAVMDSDVIFICTPVGQTMDILRRLSGRTAAGCIVTDTGSTKQEIMDYVDSMPNPPCFVGGHPMAGAEKTGYPAGTSHLFENAYYVLTKGRSTSSEAVSAMLELIQGIGAIPVVLDAAKHDLITGSISHVPHIIASALVNMIRETDTPDGVMRMLAAGGFRDITRIASSSPEMWENIVLSNKQQVSDILDNYISLLGDIRAAIDSCDSVKIYDFFNTARQYRDTIPAGKAGLISPVFDITVDIVDKPGIIGEIATLLGNKGINIKNINISNNREFEQGCLRITLQDLAGVEASLELLSSEGYRVYRHK